MSLPLDMQGFHFPEFIDLQWYLKFVQHVGNGVLELVITILGVYGSTRTKSDTISHANL